nr:Bacterial regulatory proteins, tetR family [uncultured bacterium]
MEAVLTEAVALLDEAGESALTFRALAARLGGGVASIYWYVASRDELLDRATDHVVGQVLAEVEAQPSGDDPIDDLRVIAAMVFEAIVARPWLGAYFMRNSLLQPNSMRLYDRLGQQVLRLDLTPRQQFHAVSAVVGAPRPTLARSRRRRSSTAALGARSTSPASPTCGVRSTRTSTRTSTRSPTSSRTMTTPTSSAPASTCFWPDSGSRQTPDQATWG